MTAALAAVIAFPAKRPEGRPSNAALRLEAVTLRNALATVTEERDDLAEELGAFVSERIRVAAEVVALARRGQVLLAAGHSPATHLDAIERIGHREAVRARSMTQPAGDAA